MTNSETLSSDPILTDAESMQEKKVESIEPEGKDDLSESVKGFQASLQKKQEEIKGLRDQLKAHEETEKRAKLAEMSELERANMKATEAETRAAKLELGIFVRDVIAGKNLPKAVEQLLVKSPWAIPAVSEEVDSGDIENSWEEIIESVRRHLPAYVESLVVRKEEAPEEESSTRRVDSERTVDSSVVRDHIYTLEEVQEIRKDDDLYEKHRVKILKQMAANGGGLPHR